MYRQAENGIDTPSTRSDRCVLSAQKKDVTVCAGVELMAATRAADAVQVGLQRTPADRSDRVEGPCDWLAGIADGASRVIAVIATSLASRQRPGSNFLPPPSMTQRI